MHRPTWTYAFEKSVRIAAYTSLLGTLVVYLAINLGAVKFEPAAQKFDRPITGTELAEMLENNADAMRTRMRNYDAVLAKAREIGDRSVIGNWASFGPAQAEAISDAPAPAAPASVIE